MMASRRRAWICGVADGLLLLVVLLVVAPCGEGVGPIRLVAEKASLLLGYVLPIAVLIAWRGAEHTVRLLAGRRSWLRPLLEGFAWGFLLIPGLHAVGIAGEAMAAGPPWPTIGYSSAEEWLLYFWELIQVSLVFGCAGAAVGVTMSSANRLMLRCFES